MTITTPQPNNGNILQRVLKSKPTGDVTLQDFSTERENLEIITWVKDQWAKSKGARSQIEQQWYYNMVMLEGRQYHTRVPQGQLGAGKLIIPPAPPYRVRSVTNRLRPIIRTELARVTSQRPNASIVPASSDDEDLFAAQAGEQIWESIVANKKISLIFNRSMFWMLQCGTSFIKCWWDEQSIDNMTGVRGDIKYSEVTPFHVGVPDLREPEIENQMFVLNAYTKPAEWIRTFYGKDINADTVSANEIIEGAYLNLNTNDTPDSVLCIEAWIKPGGHKLFPQGGYICVAGSEILAVSREQMPYNHGEFPFIKFDHIPTGKFYGASVLEDLVGPQREYNRTRSQIIEAKNRMAKPQLLAAMGSVDPKKITTEAGQVILYRAGMQPPTPLPLQPLPNYVLQEQEILKSDMEDISGQHEVSKGSTPPGVTAATAISFLQEKDDSLLSHTYMSIEFGFEKLAKQSLSHVVQFWSIARTVQTTGIDGSFDALTLKGSDIASGTDIRMEAGSALPTSKAARQALIMDLMKFGWVDPNEGLKLMEIGGVQKLWQTLKVDESQAQRENLRMRRLSPEELQMAQMQMDQPQIDPTTGQPVTDQTSGEPLVGGAIVPVNTWDNHQVHIEVHNRFRKTQAFENLDEQIKVQFEEHVSAHAQALMMGSQGMGPDNGMPPAPEDLNLDVGAQDSGASSSGPPPANGGGPANQFGPPAPGGSPPPPPGMG